LRLQQIYNKQPPSKSQACQASGKAGREVKKKVIGKFLAATLLVQNFYPLVGS